MYFTCNTDSLFLYNFTYISFSKTQLALSKCFLLAQYERKKTVWHKNTSGLIALDVLYIFETFGGNIEPERSLAELNWVESKLDRDILAFVVV